MRSAPQVRELVLREVSAQELSWVTDKVQDAVLPHPLRVRRRPGIFKLGNNWPHVLFARVPVLGQLKVAAHEEKEQEHKVTKHFSQYVNVVPNSPDRGLTVNNYLVSVKKKQK